MVIGKQRCGLLSQEKTNLVSAPQSPKLCEWVLLLSLRVSAFHLCGHLMPNRVIVKIKGERECI